jgi:hypothetical protein
MDVNQLAAAGFFFTNWGDVVCFAFCEVKFGQWEKGDDAFKDHQRLSPSCAFVKGLFAGNISALPNTSQQEPSSNNDVCGPYMAYTLKTSRQERCKYTFTFIHLCRMYNYNTTLIFISFTAIKFSQHNSILWDDPMYPYYSSYHARMQSFTSWPTASNKKPETLSSAGFFHTGELHYN